MARLYLIAASLNVWVLVAILAGAFGAQLILGEPPCPLCVVQRIALMMCALGPLYMLLEARSGALSFRGIAIGSGISIIAALIGAAAATRQVLLHILPGDKGFGSPLLGIHLYTWSLIAFISQIAASGLMLIGAAWSKEQPVPWRITNATAVGFLIIVVANLLSVIAEAGFNWELPPDPVGYLLFK
ncbi:MAG TPA: disulfide bond formation protein B [Xanthobacteraceae bacterium]|jgi:disulfide bond formation protein DsbB